MLRHQKGKFTFKYTSIGYIGVIDADMDLKMRITFEGKDYTFTILTKGITRGTHSILIDLQGQQYELSPNERHEWNSTIIPTDHHPELLRAIARNVSLRYRL